MVGAESFAAVVPMTTVRGVGKQHIFVLVVANPLAAAFCAGEFAFLAAQAATRGIGARFAGAVWFLFGGFVHPTQNLNPPPPVVQVKSCGRSHTQSRRRLSPRFLAEPPGAQTAFFFKDFWLTIIGLEFGGGWCIMVRMQFWVVKTCVVGSPDAQQGHFAFSATPLKTETIHCYAISK